MKKKQILFFLLILSVLSLTACTNSTAIKFKNEYEKLNGKKNAIGKKHRTINISKNNPYEKIEPKEIINKIEKKQTFYLYIGDPQCPWCRSVIEKSVEIAKKNNVKKIYYINIWDKDRNEIFRDKYEIKDGKPNKIVKGTKEYNKLLKLFDKVLSDYTLKDEDGKEIQTGEKRIFAPNFFYIKNGKVVEKVDGISEKQKDPMEKLSSEILKDEEKIFNQFFKN